MGGSHSHPVELLDQICLHVESPNDLLSVALTCKQLSRIAIPGHIEFRVLRCDFQRDSLWKALLAQPSLAAKIHTLDIISEQGYDLDNGPVIVPRSLLSAEGGEVKSPPDVHDDEKSFALLGDVIRRMPRLRRFHWLHHSTRPVNGVFSALNATCGDLEDVEVLNFDDSYRTSISTVDLGNSPLWKLTNLTHFSFTEHHIDTEADVHVKYTDAMADMLINHCPHLEDLQIFQNHHYHSDLPEESIQKLFKDGHWPNLKRLTIEGIALYENDQRFFASHPKLEKLCIRDGYNCKFVFSHLPNLESLDIDWILQSKEMPADVAAHLQYLAVGVPDESWLKNEDPDFQNVLRSAPNLKCLVLHHAAYAIDHLTSIFECIPNVERLALQWASHMGYFENAYEEPQAFCDALALLPKLTHLTYINPSLWSTEESESDDGDKEAEESEEEEADDFHRSLKALSSSAPKLSFVEFGSGDIDVDERDWMAIERDDNGAYLSYSEVGSDQKNGLDVDLWGGCYLGAAKGLLDKKEW
ncbi:hypothetical protein Hypma_005568 [Hypsizygus marmoreus]|uniref:F-box domain-containing protein n=1 Tax=Hypsizygus marmoreus TaxID=39966 RepID=A0A369K1V8_HYPMA|nr:hypothetical protein Hypma_005568 [Hypsizygus marmoreus]